MQKKNINDRNFNYIFIKLNYKQTLQQSYTNNNIGFKILNTFIQNLKCKLSRLKSFNNYNIRNL